MTTAKAIGFEVVTIDIGPTTTGDEIIDAIESSLDARKAVKLGRWVMVPPGRVFMLSEEYRGTATKVPGAEEFEDAEVNIHGVINFHKAWLRDW